MKFKYARIQGRELAENTMYAKGIFSMCWSLIQKDVMDEEDRDLFMEIDKWFAEILPWPPPCMRRENVVCFFKTENTDEMMRLIGPAMWLLEKYNHPFFLVYTNNPGEIIYEDDYQVVVKAGEPLIIEGPQPSWSDNVPEEFIGSETGTLGQKDDSSDA
ncbi:MAG: hypothetical protein E7241_09775 [Lachnospiraceae bacterium]|nr:hypothetical protein [Lachnospiraceae bacterium]